MNYLYWLPKQWSVEGFISYREWYAVLEKPFFAPEPYVFGLAWGIIYPLIGLAFLWTAYVFYIKKSGVSRKFLWLFIANIFLNLTFSATLLATHNNILISAHILLVLGTLIWLETKAWKESKLVFWLLVPYLLWGAFATILQLCITALN